MAIPYYSKKPPGGRGRFVIEAGGHNVSVVGLRHKRAAVQAFADELGETEGRTVTVFLLREPNNLHDQNAVAVWVEEHGHIGYLPTEYASDLGPAIDEALADRNGDLDIEAVATARIARPDGEDRVPATDNVGVTVHLNRRVVRGSIKEAPKARAGNSDEVRAIAARAERLSPRDLARLIGHLEALLDEAGGGK